MKSTACLLAALGVFLNVPPWAQGADPAKLATVQQPTARPPTPIRLNAAPGLVLAPPRGAPRPGYLTPLAPPATRSGPTRSVSRYSSASPSAEQPNRINPRLISSSSGLKAAYLPNDGLMEKPKLGSAAATANTSSVVKEINLQRLVRYFQEADRVRGATNNPATFKPAVNEAELSKMLAPPSEAKSQIGAKE